MALIKTQNAEGGSDARYDVSKMTPQERTQFDWEGRPLGANSAPDQWTWTNGVIGARGGTGPSGGGGIPGGGSGGDIFSNPYYQQVLAAVNAAGAADAAGRRSGIQQALIGFGEAPAGFADKFGDVDALTRELAEKNTTSGISTKARLVQARADAIREMSRAQAAKGLRRSGARGYGLRKRQLEFDQGYSDSLSKLLGYTGSLYSQFSSNEYNRALQMANAAQFASQFTGGGGGGGGGGGNESFAYDPSLFAPQRMPAQGPIGNQVSDYLESVLPKKPALPQATDWTGNPSRPVEARPPAWTPY